MRVLVDSREKNILPFLDLEIRKLDEGDYVSLDLFNYEIETGIKIIRIERKKSTAELANNLGKGFIRFEKELKRLYDYKRKILLCEFTYDDILRFPEGSGIPKHLWYKKGRKGIVRRVRMTPELILSKLEYITNIYDIEIIYAGDRFNAVNIANKIFQELSDEIKIKE